MEKVRPESCKSTSSPINHPPARRALIDELFEQINDQKLVMPDGSGREIRIKLGPKEGIVLAS